MVFPCFPMKSQRKSWNQLEDFPAMMGSMICPLISMPMGAMGAVPIPASHLKTQRREKVDQ